MKAIIGFFIAIVGVAAIASYGTIRWVDSRAKAPVDAHEWLHQALEVTPTQHKALEPIEAQFAEQNRVLRERIRGANHDLAVAIRKGQADSPEITAAVANIHQQMEALQKSTIDHVFRMRSVLTPEQGEKLLQLAERGLDMSP